MKEDRRALVARAAKGLEEEVERGFTLPVGAGFAGRIAATQQPVVVEVSDNSPIEIVNPLIQQKGVRSLLGVPLIVEGRLVGVLHIGTLERRDFDSDDIHLLRTVGDRIALAIEHQRLMELPRTAARHLQQRLQPQALPEIPELDLAARYLPAEAGVGGDWYDVIALPSGRVGVAIGDVEGKGAQAAAYMGELRSVLRAYALEELAPARALAKLARFVDLIGGPMATLVYGIIDPGESRMRIARAGHPYPLLVHPERGATYLTSGGGPPLGVVEVDSFPEHESAIEAGSTLLLYTDGLVGAGQAHQRPRVGPRRNSIRLAARSRDTVRQRDRPIRAGAAERGRRRPARGPQRRNRRMTGGPPLEPLWTRSDYLGIGPRRPDPWTEMGPNKWCIGNAVASTSRCGRAILAELRARTI